MKKALTLAFVYVMICRRMEEAKAFFLCLKLTVYRDCHTNLRKSEVEVVRVRITLACTECKQRNYNTTKDKKAHPDRMETSKYCRFCKKHTAHKETK